MPQYMLALYDDSSRWPKLSPEEMQTSLEKYMAWGKRPYVVTDAAAAFRTVGGLNRPFGARVVAG